MTSEFTESRDGTPNKTFVGVWHLPGVDHEVSGILTFGGADFSSLTVVGNLASERLPDIGAIHGFAHPGGLFTLLDCRLRTSRIAMEGWPGSSTYTVQAVVFGDHVEGIEARKYTYLRLRFTHLDVWAGLDEVWDVDVSSSPDSFSAPAGMALPVLEVSTPEYRVELLSANFELTASARLITATREAALVVKSAAPKSITEFNKIARQLQKFIALAAGAPAPLLSYLVETEVGEHYVPRRIEVHQSGFDIASNARTLPSFYMLFTRETAGSDANEYLRRWLTASADAVTVMEPFFAVLHNPHLYLESSYLQLCFALEGYHRLRIGGHYMEPDEYVESVLPVLQAAIPEGLENDFRQAIRDRLKYMAEPSFRRRLREVIALNAPAVLGRMDDPKAVIERIVSARNALVHYGISESASVLDEAITLLKYLRLMIQVSLLHEIGMSPEQADSALSTHWQRGSAGYWTR